MIRDCILAAIIIILIVIAGPTMSAMDEVDLEQKIADTLHDRLSEK